MGDSEGRPIPATILRGGKTIDHTHVLDIANITPRRFFERFDGLDRSLDLDNKLDEELIKSVKKNGVLQPIVVFNAKPTNELMLLDGQRRLEAAARCGHTAIEAIVVNTVDDMVKVLAEASRLVRENPHHTTRPMLVSEKMKFGVVIGGIGQYVRTYYRQASGRVDGYTVNLRSHTAHIIGVSLSEWQMLSKFRIVLGMQEHARRSASGNVELATTLLDRMDRGEIGIAAAGHVYNKNTIVKHDKEGDNISPRRWLEQMNNLCQSLDVLTNQMFDLRTIPDGMGGDEVVKFLERLDAPRRTLIRLNKVLTRQNNVKEVTE